MQWAVVILLSCLCWNALASPAPHCTPAAMDEDPKVARVCSALNTFLELYAEANAKVDPNTEMQGNYYIHRSYIGTCTVFPVLVMVYFPSVLQSVRALFYLLLGTFSITCWV